MPGGKVQPKGRKPPPLPSQLPLKNYLESLSSCTSTTAASQPRVASHCWLQDSSSLFQIKRCKNHTKQVHANMPTLTQCVRTTTGNLPTAAPNCQNPFNLPQNHPNLAQILLLGTAVMIQTSPQSARPGRGTPHVTADLSTSTSGRNETCHLTTTGGTAAGPPLHPPARIPHPLPPLQQSPLMLAAGSASALLVGDTSVIITTTGVHDTDTTSGMIPLCSLPWHALHLSQDTHTTAFAEVSMCPLTNCWCLRVQFQYPMLCGKPARANISNSAR
jgi:hypothetical protein